MTSLRYDVLGLGNSLVDLIAPVEDAFLVREGIQKGGMTLIGESDADRLHAAMNAAKLVAGGSAANTIVGVASFGAKAAYVGKVKSDPLGAAFIDGMRAVDVGFDTAPAGDGPGTGRCCIFVTPDGERSMNTYLGASQNLSPADVDDDVVRGSGIIYLEGYLWDPPAAKEAFLKASAIAHAAGRKVALTLSDAFCVGRYRAEFLDLIRSKTVDIVFANTAELLSLYEAEAFDAALEALRGDAACGVVTRSELGCVIVEGSTTEAVPAFPIAALVDTTGAGDLFAAGYLAGLSRGSDHATCGRLGALAAAEVIQHFGARPEVSLAQLAANHGLS